MNNFRSVEPGFIEDKPVYQPEGLSGIELLPDEFFHKIWYSQIRLVHDVWL
jgi:hypothetical protein